MIVLKDYCLTAFDVDETLVRFIPTSADTDKVPFQWIDSLGTVHNDYIVPHRKHIDQLKAHKLRGHTVLVWSAGGALWAEAVIKALDLVAYVDVVSAKPKWAYDDQPPEKYMPQSSWIKDPNFVLEEK